MTETHRTLWLAIHAEIERYERWSLLIKLAAVAVVLLSTITTFSWTKVLMLVLVLWLQDGIWKTFQGRSEAFILKLESESGDTNPYSLYSDWQNSRRGAAGLIAEYVKSALRPTVAYPYLALSALTLYWGWM